MLEHLSVRNYVLIDHLDIDFHSGFTVLTGETGSGKTIMLGALSLLLGAKADRNDVRLGENSAEITGLFSVSSKAVFDWADEHGIEIEDNEILIRRLIKATGKGAYTVNGSPVTVKEGEELGHMLVDVSSQHSHQSLLRNDVLRSILDKFSSLEKEKDSYTESYKALRSIENEIKELEERVRRSREEADYMRFSLGELEKADLREGEEEELKKEVEIMGSSEFLKENLSAAISEMKSASASLGEALDAVRKASKKDDRLAAEADRTESIGIEADDIMLSLRGYFESIDYSESELEEKNSRLMILQRIRRKYGGSIEEAIRRRDEYRLKLEESENSEEILESLRKKRNTAYEDAVGRAEKLLSERKRGALRLSHKIEEMLHLLGMKAAIFEIRTERTETLNPDGMDRISFLIAPNKGEKLSPIENTASGGELSRIMLALKVTVNASGDASMLFDEIDTGIGGTVANAVGEEMKKLAEREQVIAITHLAQIASRASSHYLVEKEEKNGRTMTRIRCVEGEERVKEIARLLSGETSNLSLEHARMLLKVQC